MATERQVAANRRNAAKSTGPRTSAGKRRIRRNSYRHGLSVGAAGRLESAEHVESQARKIAGAGADALMLEQARCMVQAQLDLIQIRRMKASLIQRIAEFGEFDIADPLRTSRDVMRMLKSMYRGLPSLSVAPAPNMPSAEPDRTAEAMRRVLPELLKLDRYERSAAARRDKATRLLADRRNRKDNH
jgi:hypothetical protein